MCRYHCRSKLTARHSSPTDCTAQPHEYSAVLSEDLTQRQSVTHIQTELVSGTVDADNEIAGSRMLSVQLIVGILSIHRYV